MESEGVEDEGKEVSRLGDDLRDLESVEYFEGGLDAKQGPTQAIRSFGINPRTDFVLSLKR
jgi:hypothetical protein